MLYRIFFLFFLINTAAIPCYASADDRAAGFVTGAIATAGTVGFIASIACAMYFGQFPAKAWCCNREDCYSHSLDTGILVCCSNELDSSCNDGNISNTNHEQPCQNNLKLTCLPNNISDPLWKDPAISNRTNPNWGFTLEGISTLMAAALGVPMSLLIATGCWLITGITCGCCTTKDYAGPIQL